MLMRGAFIAITLCLASCGSEPDQSMIHATQPFLYGEAAMSPSQRDAFVKASTTFAQQHGYTIRSARSVPPMTLVIYDRIPAELNIVAIDRGEGEKPLVISATVRGGSPNEEQRKVIDAFLADIQPLIGPISQCPNDTSC